MYCEPGWTFAFSFYVTSGLLTAKLAHADGERDSLALLWVVLFWPLCMPNYICK